MRTCVGLGTGRHYPLTTICAIWRVAQSTVYAARPSPAVADGTVNGRPTRATQGHP
jgi:hypothetical protein